MPSLMASTGRGSLGEGEAALVLVVSAKALASLKIVTDAHI